MNSSKGCVYKAAAVEGTAKYFLDLKLTVVELTKFKIRLIHGAIDKLAVSKDGPCYAGAVIVAAVQGNMLHNGVV